MSNIVMSVQTWKEVMNRDDKGPRTAQDIIFYFAQGFGKVALSDVKKGENEGWYMDQNMVSLRIEEWIQKHNRSLVHYVPRDTGRDRLDRQSWIITGSTMHKIDCHVLENSYLPGAWQRLLALMKELFDEAEVKECCDYWERFLRTLPEYRDKPSPFS